MPRKKAADRVGPVKTRSLCSTQLVLKWESEFVSRGLAFGRAGVWSKSGSQSKTSPSSASLLDDDQEWCDIPFVESWGFVNSGVSTFEQPDQVNVACDELNAVVVRDKGKGRLAVKSSWPALVDISEYGPILQQLPQPTASLPLFPPVTGQNQGHLFEYYLQQVCPRTTASSKLSSPFASIILPFCLSASPILFKAIQALGACHWSRFDPTYGVIGLHLKSEALRGLRHRLATEGTLSCSTDPEVLAIMMMLCLYEIVDNCDERWTIHLKGAKDLIRLRRQQTMLSKPRGAQDPITTFAELFFAFQDVMGRTACGEEVLFGSDYWQENERNIDLWMGCSPELVSILSSITELSRTRRQLTSDSARAAFSLRAASLGHKLENLVQEIDGDDDGDDQTLQTAAELKRLAAVLYLHCALHGASPSTPLVVTYVRKILRLVSDLLDSGSLVSMTWPVFVAAVELDPLHDEVWSDGETVVYGRPLVLRALAAMAESSVSNVARTRAVIVKVWQARDSDMLKGSTVDSLDHTTGCNDWECKLSEQLSQRKEQGESVTDTESSGKSTSLGPPLRPSPKSRSLSDAPKPISARSTSEEHRPSSKDDNSLSSTPETPRRPSMQGLPLNLPSKPSGPSSLSSRAPLSPKLDSSQIYGSPGSVLPRRSRGLDFSRACTNLHHSTLAELSPDSSPIIVGRGMTIPQRRGSMGSTSVPPFSTSGPADRTAISSSVSSVNMMESDTSSSEEDDEPMMADRDDMIMNTPQANKMGSGMSPFAVGNVPSPGNDWMGGYSQAAASLMSFQRARFRKGRSRHSSSSASGNSSKPSPGPLSPPVMKSIENQNGYFGSRSSLSARRESLSLGTRDLRLSDLSDEGENRGNSPGTSNSEGGPLGVIRRATSPSLDALSSSNPFQPTDLNRNLDDVPAKTGTSVPDEPNFSEEANRNSGGAEFWNHFDERYRTPPPPPLRQMGTSVSEDDLSMDITPSTTMGSTSEFAKPSERPSSRCSTPIATQPISILEFKRKRRREDDFDPNLFKRRAVSPSMSVQSSPVMPNSPAVRDTGTSIWGPPKANIGSLFPDQPSTESGTRNPSTPKHAGHLKRVGLQGMTETNDGLMNMSIE
ncbi:unnamed protein product [Aspergillus oryzae]|nr:unnamed protein product [Aspergillus oryzae]